MTTIVVMAKECIPGRVKTRLHPPFTLEQAAEVAAACLFETLELVRSLPVTRRILCIDLRSTEAPAGIDQRGFEVIPQSDGGLDERIGAVLDVCAGPTFLIGMDTPQLRAEDFGDAFEGWSDRRMDAYLGPATDGGFWGLGLANPRGDLVRGVAMSREDTGALQRERLLAAGLRVRELAAHTDVDDAASLDVVHGMMAPDSRLSRLLAGWAAR